MTSRPEPSEPAPEGAAFADLPAFDVVDGELLPRAEGSTPGDIEALVAPPPAR